MRIQRRNLASFAEAFGDAKELVVFCDAISRGHGARLDLAHLVATARFLNAGGSVYIQSLVIFLERILQRELHDSRI